MKKVRTIIHIINWLNNYYTNTSGGGFIVGVSGGIDSALVSTLCAKTNKKVIAISMPMYDHYNLLAYAHLKWLSNNFLNVEIKEIDLTDSFQVFYYETIKPHIFLEEEEGLVMANAMSRFRMTALYAIANYNNMLVVGTGNKVEDFGVGFFTKYGDGGVDISPIADLMKSEVRELAEYLKIDKKIIQAAPTDGLWYDNRTDEDQIGETYDELEWAMNYKFSKVDILSKRQEEILKIYNKRHTVNQHKMNPIPVCNIPEILK